MTAAIIIPIAIWQARRARQAAHKREQELIEALEAELDAQDERARLAQPPAGEGRQ